MIAIDGISAIAARLTASGVPTPMDYKLPHGMRYTTAFRTKRALREERRDGAADSQEPGLYRRFGAGPGDNPSYQVKRIIHGECGGPMVRKTVPSDKKKYVYFVCGAHKDRKERYSHALCVEALDEIVLEALHEHIREVKLGLDNLFGIRNFTSSNNLSFAGIYAVRSRSRHYRTTVHRSNRYSLVGVQDIMQITCSGFAKGLTASSGNCYLAIRSN